MGKHLDSSTRAERVGRALEVMNVLEKRFPGTASSLCTLDRRSPFELLVATILSAQCTDERVNMVTPRLFSKYSDPESLARANLDELEEIIRSTGFYHAKASNLKSMAQSLVTLFDREVPSELNDLTLLAGVGRKTGNVIRSIAFDLPGLPVDTHVKRVANRLGLVVAHDPVEIEKQLGDLVPSEEWGVLSIRLILHGRSICKAKSPDCENCPFSEWCPSSSIRTPPLSNSPNRRSKRPK